VKLREIRAVSVTPFKVIRGNDVGRPTNRKPVCDFQLTDTNSSTNPQQIWW